MTFPSPFNPDNLPPAASGYRYLGPDEMPKAGDEFKTLSNDWMTCSEGKRTTRPNLTYRRALSIDDQYAPPPSEWLTPGYQVSGPVTPDGRTKALNDEEYWGWANKGWCFSTNGLAYYHPVYIRRKVRASAPSAPTLNTKREVVVYIGDSVALSNMLKAIFRTDTPTRLYAGYVLIRGDEIAGCNVDSGAYRSIHYVGVIWIDAYTEMGKLIDLLPSLKTPPAPVAPTINGYVAQYTKGSSTVTFGCAQISIELIKGMKGALNTIEAYGPYRGNRFMTGFVLNSGVKLGREDVKSILAYVDQVNGANAPKS